MAKNEKITLANKQEQLKFCEKLLGCPIMTTLKGRQQILKFLPTSISHRISEDDAALNHTIAIVQTCANYPAGLDNLVEGVYEFEKDGIPWRAVEAYLKQVAPGWKPRPRQQFIPTPSNQLDKGLTNQPLPNLGSSGSTYHIYGAPGSIINAGSNVSSSNQQIGATTPAQAGQDEAELRRLAKTYLTQQIKRFEKELQRYIQLFLKPGQLISLPEPEALRIQATLSKNLEPGYYVPPTRNYQPKPDETQPEVDLQAELATHHHLVLLGPPGAGKTTTLRQLFKKRATGWLNDATSPLPIFAALNRWPVAQKSLLGFLRDQLTDDGWPELTEHLPRLWRSGRLLLLLDGLNELPQLQRDEETGLLDDPRSQAIAVLIDEPADSRNTAVLTCRVGDFLGGPAWRNLHIRELQPAQIRQFSQAYYRLNWPYEYSDQLSEKLEAALYPARPDPRLAKLQGFVARPFYLVRLLNFFQANRQTLPPNPASLIKFSVEEALNYEITAGRLTAEQANELQTRLPLLAFNLTEANRVMATNHALAAAWFFYLLDIDYHEPKISSSQQERAEALYGWAVKANLLTVVSEGVQFYHQLLQEYFCARYLQNQPLELVLQRRWVTEDRFSEVWQLWNGLCGNDYALTQLLTLLKKPQVLKKPVGWFSRLLPAHQEPSVLEAAHNAAFYVHYNAEKALGWIGEPAVLPLLELLEDEDREVRDSAAYVLGRIDDSRALLPLVKRFKDEDRKVRGSAAEALARIGEPAVLPLLELLKDEDNEVRATAAVALGRIDDSRVLPALEFVARHDSGQFYYGRTVRTVKDVAAQAIQNIKWRQEEQD